MKDEVIEAAQLYGEHHDQCPILRTDGALIMMLTIQLCGFNHFILHLPPFWHNNRSTVVAVPLLFYDILKLGPIVWSFCHSLYNFSSSAMSFLSPSVSSASGSSPVALSRSSVLIASSWLVGLWYTHATLLDVHLGHLNTTCSSMQ